MQDLLHEGRELSHQSLVAVILSDVGDEDGPEGEGARDSLVGDRRGRDAGGAPHRVGYVLSLAGADPGVRLGVLVAEEQEHQRPGSADQAEHVEDGRPAAREAVRG